MENKRTILLTGSSGFLGTRILSKINKNDTVYLLSNKNSVSTLNPNHFEITINELDNFAKFDKIIHCAGRTTGNDKDIWESNYQLTKKLISFSKKNRAHFLFISSLNAGLNHRGQYENSKYEAERELLSKDIDFVIIRPSYLFDKNDEPNLKNFRLLFPFFKIFPILLIPPYDFLVQPLNVCDLANFCVERMNKKDYLGRIIEVAGPSSKSIYEVISQYFIKNKIKIKLIRLPKIFFAPLCFCFKSKMNILFQDKILRKNKEVTSLILDGNKISNI
tara:strand:- start:359 stop:1186 length:828 start_codon:yes stop_codon:yes gene_type:complete